MKIKILSDSTCDLSEQLLKEHNITLAPLTVVKGVAVLNKVYGPLHPLYMVYLLGYFTAMIVVIFRASAKKKLESTMHAVGLTIAVFVNIGVWLLEQFVHFDIEMLAVSYIISELFLITLHFTVKEA